MASVAELAPSFEEPLAPLPSMSSSSFSEPSPPSSCACCFLPGESAPMSASNAPSAPSSPPSNNPPPSPDALSNQGGMRAERAVAVAMSIEVIPSSPTISSPSDIDVFPPLAPFNPFLAPAFAPSSLCRRMASSSTATPPSNEAIDVACTPSTPPSAAFPFSDFASSPPLPFAPASSAAGVLAAKLASISGFTTPAGILDQSIAAVADSAI
mmetsp:Transcript_33562/g.49097  ORF Transcript_33562/g.49097 Transcript_33562/m.49097 type:complete len:211 (-) Transcript_33562:1596-2228(-)